MRSPAIRRPWLGGLAQTRWCCWLFGGAACRWLRPEFPARPSGRRVRSAALCGCGDRRVLFVAGDDPRFHVGAARTAAVLASSSATSRITVASTRLATRCDMVGSASSHAAAPHCASTAFVSTADRELPSLRAVHTYPNGGSTQRVCAAPAARELPDQPAMNSW
jgi:hypothetical protein